MNRATLDLMVQELKDVYCLPPADWEAIVQQAERLQAAIGQLGELPLGHVEPVAVYRFDDDSAPQR